MKRASAGLGFVTLVTLVIALAGGARQAPTGTGRVAIDLTAPATPIPPTLYGIFYEEINHAGDGGLYAELVRNRGFEDANLPPACVLDGEFIVPPRTPHFDTGKPNNWLRWDVANPHPYWSLEATGGAEATMALTVERPLHEATPHSLAVSIVKPAGTDGRVALVNEGYWGIGVARNAEYVLDFHARMEGPDPRPLVASLETASGVVLARREFSSSSASMKLTTRGRSESR